jgi:hypothetical protein
MKCRARRGGMGKSPKKAEKEIELEPGAWQRFERFFAKAAKTHPCHG